MNFSVDETIPLFSMNRQERDAEDLDGDGNVDEPLFFDAQGNPTPVAEEGATPVFDGDIKFVASQLIQDLLIGTRFRSSHDLASFPTWRNLSRI